jgi:hypothetical protein
MCLIKFAYSGVHINVHYYEQGHIEVTRAQALAYAVTLRINVELIQRFSSHSMLLQGIATFSCISIIHVISALLLDVASS